MEGRSQAGFFFAAIGMSKPPQKPIKARVKTCAINSGAGDAPHGLYSAKMNAAIEPTHAPPNEPSNRPDKKMVGVKSSTFGTTENT